MWRRLQELWGTLSLDYAYRAVSLQDSPVLFELNNKLEETVIR